MLRDEFLIQLQKFLNQIGLTLRQLEGQYLVYFLEEIRLRFFVQLFRRSST